MAWNGPCMGHGDGGCGGGDADQKLRARYVQAALDNHVSIHQPYFTSTVDTSGNENWGTFDQYSAQFLDGTADTRLQGAKLTSVSVNGASNANVVRGWSNHFKQKGWTATTLFDYVCDEPPMTCQWSDINPRIAQVRAGDPSMPTLVTTTTWDASANGVSGIDIFTPVVNYVDGKPNGNPSGNQRAKFGSNVWWYQSCMSFGCVGVGAGIDSSTAESGWPTYAVDSDATRNRAMEWMSFTYDMSGELYYETTMGYFLGDVWSNQSAFGGTGDGTLFYPGTPARIGGQTEIPVESLRLKGIRDGMEDYELLNMAKTLGLTTQAKAIAAGLFPHTYQATATAAAVDSARAELAALILHALGKDTQPAASTGGGTTPSDCTTTACTAPVAATQTPAAATPQGGLAAIGYPAGGCSSTGPQSLWLALPAFAFFALRRRRTA
jgi:MYXO-CTERM domain-containing protein